MFAATSEDTRRVTVFRDHATWDAHEKWWMVPLYLANELFVARYDCNEDCFQQHLAWIEREHPGCVYVY